MRRSGEIKAPKYSDELPSSSDYVSSHDAPIPDLASVRLSAGQGTDQHEIVIIAELWAGEATIFDPKSGTEVAIWFDRANLRLLMAGCDIKPGSRFGERQTPSLPTTVVNEETKEIGSLDAKARLEGALSQSHSAYNLNASGQLSAYRLAASSRISTTKREQMGTPYVVAGPSQWEITIVGNTSFSPPNIEQGTSLFKYITTDDRLCDLLIKKGTRRIRVQAVVRTFPSNLRYRVHTKSRITRLRDQLTINQDRIIRIMLKKGLAAPDEEGMAIATAHLRPARSKK